MTDKHTPGPWHICEYANIGARCKFAVSTGEARDAFRLADIYNDNCHEAANARLIAAAPELLAALYRACDALTIEDYSEREHELALEQIRAAIAKAVQP